jgi:CBS domain-containing protein
MTKYDQKREHIQQILQIQPVGMPALDLKVSDCMTQRPLTVTESTCVREVLQIYNKRQFRRLFVVNAVGKLVGIVNEREIINLANRFVRGIRPQLQDMLVKQIMSLEVLTTSADTLVLTALRLMLEKGTTFLPVIEKDEFVGIVSSADLYVVLEQLLDPVRQKKHIPAHHHEQVRADVSEWLCRT